jgi:adenylate cyclase
LRSLASQDFTAACLAFSAINQWFLGYAEKAFARATEAMTGAVARGETYGQAFAFGIGAAALFLLRVDNAEMEARVEHLRRLALEEGFAAWKIYADVFVGRLITLRGDHDRLAGVRRMQAAITEWRNAGLVPDTDILTTVLADTCLTAASQLGQNDQAEREDLLATGLAAIRTMIGSGNVPCGCHWAAELHHLRGELLLMRDGLAAAGEALDCFQTALVHAREYGFPAVELRAATSLVRLRKCQGEGCMAELIEARKLLRNLYECFTEGFSFPDLQEAAALIDETG